MINSNNNRRKFLHQAFIITGGMLLYPYRGKSFFKKEDMASWYVVPNMHPASCGWLVNFCEERVYCANTYMAHMDRVNEDPEYKFVVSEVNNLIAINDFRPDRFKELQNQIDKGRTEIVNAFFCELTPNLSGVEPIIRSGLNGLKWYEEVMALKPRFNWMIDVAGMNEQMAQVTANLGLDAIVHCRMNISDSPVYDLESPDGTKVRTISPGHYFTWKPVFIAEKPMTDEELKSLNEESKKLKKLSGLPRVILAGKGDYALPPIVKTYPAQFIKDWKKVNGTVVKFATFSDFFDVVQQQIKKENITVPVIKRGWGYSWDGFWVENHKVKKLFRQAEYALYSAELLASVTSIKTKYQYPAQKLYSAWIQMNLNSDRNSLWGAATEVVFQDPKSWDVQDRYNWIKQCCKEITTKTIAQKITNTVTVFNPLNWPLTGPLALTLPAGKQPKKIPSQTIGGQTYFMPNAPAMSLQHIELENTTVLKSEATNLPEVIENDFYRIKIDKHTGEFVWMILKSSGKEILGKNSNVFYGDIARSDKSLIEQGPNILPEDALAKNDGTVYHAIEPRKFRIHKATSKHKQASIKYTKGSVAHVIEITKSLNTTNDVQQTIIIYHHHSRIDFEVQMNDIPDKNISFIDFNFAGNIAQCRRGIPGGIATETAAELLGRSEGIYPAIEWSCYDIDNGTSFAIMDKALPGREVSDKKAASLILYAASDTYMRLPGGWLSGKGSHQLSFSIFSFDTASPSHKNVIKEAKEYNLPVSAFPFTSKFLYKPFFTTSANVIIQSVQRVKNELEIRFTECYNEKGIATIVFEEMQGVVRHTDFLGQGEKIAENVNEINVPVRPQQIVTLRIKTKTSVANTKSIRNWNELVPQHKREMLKFYDPKLLGRPALHAH